jgi:ABC-type branched-subunit amino acid transport system ATPase component
MVMPILNLKQVSVRFGGLTAVNRLDCAVEAGQIFSIIGPNGAGKTTVFNAITGIYEPAAGAIEFEGRQLRRPFNAKVVLACAAIGLVTGLALMLIAADVDSLWRATIKRNYLDLNTPFSYASAWRDLKGYLRGDLAIEHRGRRWLVVPADSGRPLAVESEEAAALADRDELQSIVSLLARGRVAELQSQREKPDEWTVRFPEQSGFPEQTVRLGKFAGPTLASRELDTLAHIAATRTQRRQRMWAGLWLGIVIGSAGAYIVWHRARRTPEVVALGGIARTFQNIRLFQCMTVLENVLTARDRHFHTNVAQMSLRTAAVRREETANVDRAKELLAFVGLDRQLQELAGSLPYGDQRRLEIARALATEPKLILLDEPAAGMNPTESADITRLIDKIRASGITVLLIEHHMKVVMGISHRIAVLDYGVKIGEGTPQEVRNNPEVIKAYLGSEEVT